MGLNQKINKILKTHNKRKKDGARQIYKAKGGVPKTGGWGRTTGEARETGWGQLHKVLYNLFVSILFQPLSISPFWHTGSAIYNFKELCKYFVTSNS